MQCIGLILFREEPNDAWSSFLIWGTTQESHAERLLTFSEILLCLVVWNTVKHHACQVEEFLPTKWPFQNVLSNSLEKGRFHFKSSLSPSWFSVAEFQLPAIYQCTVNLNEISQEQTLTLLAIKPPTSLIPFSCWAGWGFINFEYDKLFPECILKRRPCLCYMLSWVWLKSLK